MMYFYRRSNINRHGHYIIGPGAVILNVFNEVKDEATKE
jgi:hypothetical protein